MRFLVVAISACLVAACAGQKKGGLSEPGTFTSPPKYLETVGLGTHTKDDVLRVLGPPDKDFSSNGMDMWTYTVSPEGTRRDFIYIFKGETLYDVRYDESGLAGPYDGYTAREAQSKSD